MTVEHLIPICLALVYIAQAYILVQCWKDDTFPKHVRFIYSIILLFPLVGGYIYYRDQKRTERDLDRFNRSRGKNPWEL